MEVTRTAREGVGPEEEFMRTGEGWGTLGRLYGRGRKEEELRARREDRGVR
jgi:hypothetical protein